MYSGPVAAHAYRLLRGRAFDVAVLVGPSHFVGFDGVSLYPSGGFETPFGVAPIDAECAARDRGSDVRSCASIRPRTRASTRSKCSCRFSSGWRPALPIVPLLMGYQTAADRGARSATRSPRRSAAAGRCSSPAPICRTITTRRTAAALDRVVIDCVARFDADGLQARARRAARTCLRRRADGRRDARRARARRARRARSSTTPTPATCRATSRRSSATSPRRWAASTNSPRTMDAARTMRARAGAVDDHANTIASSCCGSRVKRSSRSSAARRRTCQAPPTILAQPGRRVRHPPQRRRAARLHRSHRADRAARATSCRAARSPPAAPIRAFRRSRPSELDAIDIEISLLGPLEPIAGPQDIDVGRARPRRRARVAARPAAAAGRDRVAVGCRDVSRADLPQGRPAARRLEAGREALAVRGGGVRREVGRDGQDGQDRAGWAGRAGRRSDA